MPTAPTAITALPTPPQRSDSANFAARGDAFLTALPTFRTEVNNLGTNVYNNAVEADADAVAANNSATAAANSATAAAASATAAATSAGVSAWVSGSTYSVGTAVYSPLNFYTYRRIVAGAGATDPSSDSTNWLLISGTVTSVAVSGGATGLTTTGGPITSTGTISLAGTLAVSNGGTGQTSFTNGQLLIGNTTGNTLTKSTLTAGSGITITNGAGSITITNSSTGGAQDYIVQRFGIV